MLKLKHLYIGYHWLLSTVLTVHFGVCQSGRIQCWFSGCKKEHKYKFLISILSSTKMNVPHVGAYSVFIQRLSIVIIVYTKR